MATWIEGDAEALAKRFIQDIGIDPQDTGDEADRLAAEVARQLEQLAQSQSNAAEGGGFSVRVGKRHIKLKKVLWDTAITGGLAAASTLDPTPVSKIAAVLKAAEFLKGLTSLVESLTSVELFVYDAISAATGARRAKSLQSAYPSQSDLAAFITARGEQVPPNLGDVLVELAQKGAVARELGDDGVTRYKRVF
jgi:hypothetical protein